MSNKKTILIYSLLSLIFLFCLTLLYLRFKNEFSLLYKDVNGFRSLILSYGKSSIFVFMFYQVLQIILPILPGEVTQISGGYLYGTIMGTIYIFIATIVGEIIAFYLSRYVGYPLVKVLVSKKHLEKFDFLLNHKKGEAILFLLFLIPGIPKDILVYISGLTPIKPFIFLVISLTARFPAILASAYIGSNLFKKDYTPVIILSVLTLISLIIGFVFKKQLIIIAHKVTNKKNIFKRVRML